MKIYIVYSYEPYAGKSEILKAFYNKNDADDYIKNNIKSQPSDIYLRIKETIIK